jgi:8-hydroxy-5-deazaflavin:NADPH oxidoreductase
VKIGIIGSGAMVFNSITAESITALGRPKGDRALVALAVSGDDAGAKEVAFGLVEALGFDPFNVGTIAQSWKQQPGPPSIAGTSSLRK